MVASAKTCDVGCSWIACYPGVDRATSDQIRLSVYECGLRKGQGTKSGVSFALPGRTVATRVNVRQARVNSTMNAAAVGTVLVRATSSCLAIVIAALPTVQRKRRMVPGIAAERKVNRLFGALGADYYMWRKVAGQAGPGRSTFRCCRSPTTAARVPRTQHRHPHRPDAHVPIRDAHPALLTHQEMLLD